MKVGILTQPLHNNYGGLLQAYALQATLKKMGHEAWIIRRVKGKKTLIWKIVYRVRKLISRNLFVKKSISLTSEENRKFTQSEKELISRNTSQFVRDNIRPVTNNIYSNRELKRISKQGFNAFIVGSDQVWRLKYSPNMLNFFLDFVEYTPNIRRIAYAASFGTDFWHFPESLTKRCKRLAQSFDAISVREDSAVQLCKENFGVDAVHIVDPTLLLTKEAYLTLIENEGETFPPQKLYSYILDATPEKLALVNQCASILNLSVFEIMPSDHGSFKLDNNVSHLILPSVLKWLKGFAESEFIITDSFHGCTFAILFNTPFIVLDNPKRGSCRITSLLRMFDLSDRLCSKLEDFTDICKNKTIDWDSVNVRIIEEREKALTFLSTFL